MSMPRSAKPLKARLDSPVAANVAAQTVALEKLAGSLDLANPQMPMKQLKLPLAGSLRADLAKQSAALELGTQFDESKIAPNSVAKFAPLALGFDLDIDQLNVDKYLPPKKAEEKGRERRRQGCRSRQAGLLGAQGARHRWRDPHRRLQVSKLKLAKLDAKIQHRRWPAGRGAAQHEPL
jgi:AsmA protein